ncbi:MAG TPA: hypothetical protein PKK33_09665, partial [Candidatus Cloacimonadota bacterium]|nr:hypothetical protein [Candidatus Cloacimonadota bacterium]
PKNAEEVTDYYLVPLPNLSTILSGLDYLKNTDYDKAVDKNLFAADKEVYKTSFALGVLTADGVLAVKAKNKTKLMAISTAMIDDSKFIGIDENILKLADELQGYVKAEDWKNLELALDKYKIDVESSLFESKRYDLFTLMQLGGWTEGLNRITNLINTNYKADNSTLVDQKGILNELIDNMNKIDNENITKADYFFVAKSNFAKIKQIIYAPINGTYTKDQLTELNKLTQEIKDSFKAK